MAAFSVSADGHFNIPMTSLISLLGASVLGDSWEAWGVDKTAVKTVTIPDSVTAIGECAFSGCSLLRSIAIPHSVTNIGDRAFEGCSSLISITIPHSVVAIAARTFYGCR